MENEFLKNTSLISYSAKKYQKNNYSAVSEVILSNKTNTIEWLNTYGTKYTEIFKTIVANNNLDDFLMKLFMNQEHSNKVILLDDLVFISTRVLITKTESLESEQMLFF